MKQGVKRTYLVRQSIYVKIALNLEHNGKEVIKSMLHEQNFPKRAGKDYSNPGVAYVLSYYF